MWMQVTGKKGGEKAAMASRFGGIKEAPCHRNTLVSLYCKSPSDRQVNLAIQPRVKWACYF